MSFFNTQIADQDWSLQTDWASDDLAGSIWSAEREGHRLSTNLQVFDHGDKEHTAVFSVRQYALRTGAR